jgi:threonine synthase
MDSAFEGYVCRDCGEPTEAPVRCPACGGPLDAQYGDVAVTTADIADRRFESAWRYRELLPLVPPTAGGEGTTPLVDCPRVADELGVGDVLVKDEGHNPTGSVADRDGALAVAGAAAEGAEEVALASTGDDGQAVAAAAAREGLEARVFVPSRAGFAQKAMVNVHGGEMRVVEGRLPDAEAAYADYRESADGGVHGVGAGETPLRREARTTVAYELLEQRDWSAPDAVVVPAGHGLSLVGLEAGFARAREAGWVEGTPRLYAAQAEGCAPVVRAVEAGELSPWETPDTICGEIEVPDPAVGERAAAAVEASGGEGVATADDAILDAAVALAAQGVEAGASAAVAAAGAWALAERGALGTEETVVVLNTAAGNKTADVLRSHLMGQGL